MSRAIAMTIDVSIVVVMIGITGSLAQLASLLLPKWLWFSAFVPPAAGVIVALLPVLYFFVPTAFIGGTPGKQLMGLRVVSLDGRPLPALRCLLRVFGYVISLIPLGAGFLWVLVGSDRRGWHDHIAGSRVVRAVPLRRMVT